MIPGRYRTGWAPIHTGNKATAVKRRTYNNKHGSSYNWRRPQCNAQIQTTTTTLYRRVCNLRRMETQVCSLLGVTELTIPKASTSSRNIRPTSYRRASKRRCSKQRRSRSLDTTQQRSTLPTHQCLSRTSSCPVQAAHTTGSWPRNMETTTQALFNSPWYTQCRVPYKTVETTVQRKQIWGVFYNMGIWNSKVRKRQPSTNTRQHQNCNTTQWDQRTTTAILTTTSRSHTTICRHSRAHSRVPQSINSILQNASTTTCNEQQHRWYTAHGHWSYVQRKR